MEIAEADGVRLREGTRGGEEGPQKGAQCARKHGWEGKQREEREGHSVGRRDGSVRGRGKDARKTN